MTPKQITKKLETAGISLKGIEVRKGEIEIWTGNFNSTERLKNKIGKLFGWGGFRCGYGGWVLHAVKTPEMGDYNYVGSRHHY